MKPLQRRALLQALLALAAGSARAGAASHALQDELREVHAAMAAGDYRHALAFGAHVAGEHADSPQATALYEWLLAVGGQAVRGPAPVGATPTGAVLAGGRLAMAPASLLGGADRVRLRNALGREVDARRLQLDDGVALLELAGGWPAPEALAAGPRDAFAGSAAAVPAFADAGGPARWPWMRVGFLGGPWARASRDRRLGIEAPAAAQGAPVVDLSGRLVGWALDDQRWRPASALPTPPSEAFATPAAPAATTASLTLAELYEKVLRATVTAVPR